VTDGLMVGMLVTDRAGRGGFPPRTGTIAWLTKREATICWDEYCDAQRSESVVKRETLRRRFLVSDQWGAS
jgi:hypothetical protein